MKKTVPAAIAGAAVLALGLTTVSPVQAATTTSSPRGDSAASKPDNRPSPFSQKQAKDRKKAVELIVNGKAKPQRQAGGGSVVTLEDGTAVELFDNDKQARIWTVLSEFGTQSSGRYGRGDGPLHNQIAQPDRTVDNSTQWTADFNLAHYDAMFNTGNEKGESFKDYYLNQSNGQYTADVTTEDWVQVPYNGSYYGDNAHEDAGGSWQFIGDTVDAWYAKQVASGKTAAEIDTYLAQFDMWDRYDFNNNGNFNEPDGYIDHFQAIHAGAGEEAGGGALGEDAIWSHRWYADYTTQGAAGPTGNLLGGQQIGGSKYWIGDYTVEPENGGLGVFAHEYGHDLGLPDFYDTNAGENGSGFWTLMSSGSWMNHGDTTAPTSFLYGIGGTPNDMGPEEKLFLGWLDPQIAAPGTSGSHVLRAMGDATSNDAVVVPLPDSTTSATYTTPYAGDHAWWSGSRSNLTATLTRDVPAASSVTVTAKLWYDTEADYDYWWAEYSTDGGATWTKIGRPVDGESRGWVSKRFSYRPGGVATQFRFVYKSDGGVNDAGLFLDEIVTKAGRTVLDTEGAESTTSAWTADEFTRSTGTATTTAARYYLLENRDYVGNYEGTMQTGPYNFGWGLTKPDWVEHFPYQNGMLVWLVDQGVADNNTSQHPGTAYALPIDAHPAPLTWSDGSVGRSRIQMYDATFGLQATDAISLQREVADGTTQTLTGGPLAAVPTFDDRLDYYDEALPGTSVETANVGVVATVTAQDASTLTVNVTNPATP